LINAASIFYERENIRMSADERAFLRERARFAVKNWTRPDSGIWETRREPVHFLHSKLMAWLAFDRTAALCEAGLLDGGAETFREAADQVASLIRDRGYNSTIGSYTQTLDGMSLDASVLLMPIIGFEDAAGERMSATISAVQKHLARDELVFRHQSEETAGEGAFLLCSFWLVQCLAAQGKLAEARAMFEKLCARSNDVGLYSEEIDPVSGRFLGNFPQAFTHIGLINAALALAAAENTSSGSGK
jgi:GH15 family glucan-1,4-alpha-glucosidase